MAGKTNPGSSKGQNKLSTKSASSRLPSKTKKAKPRKPTAKAIQQKSKSSTQSAKRKPPHLRYTEKALNIPQLNGIRPAGVQKPPNAKKGKVFVDDKEQMNTILAIVMAEKEGNIESKMMRARQLEEVREARKLEAEKRAESKKAGLEEKKKEIKDKKRNRRHSNVDPAVTEDNKNKQLDVKKPRKRVSFG